MTNFKNLLTLFIGKRRWMKRCFKFLMGDEAYRDVDGLKVFMSAKDFRGPSYYLMYGGSEAFYHYEQEAKDEIVSYLPEEGGVMLDIGANIGLFSLYAHKKKKNLKTYLFEPHPVISHCLEQSISSNYLNGFSLIKKALSENEGEMTFFMDAINDGGHSLLADQIEDNTGMTEILVAVTTLDLVIKEKEIEKVDAVKIDVQGAEHMVLQGGLETLEKMGPPLLIECENISLGGPHCLIEVLKKLQRKYYVKRIGLDEKLELDELIPIARDLHQKGILYQDFLFFSS